MSFRTILVPIEQHDLMSSTLETALCLARKFDSYIEGFTLRVANPAAYAMADPTAVTMPNLEHDFAENAIVRQEPSWKSRDTSSPRQCRAQRSRQPS